MLEQFGGNSSRLRGHTQTHHPKCVQGIKTIAVFLIYVRVIVVLVAVGLAHGWQAKTFNSGEI